MLILNKDNSFIDNSFISKLRSLPFKWRWLSVSDFNLSHIDCPRSRNIRSISLRIVSVYMRWSHIRALKELPFFEWLLLLLPGLLIDRLCDEIEILQVVNARIPPLRNLNIVLLFRQRRWQYNYLFG